MKYVKLFEEYLNESVEQQLLTDPVEIEKWLATWKDEIIETRNIKREYIEVPRLNGAYTIRPDGIVDVIGDVNLYNKEIIKLPIQFGEVTGDFICQNSNMATLIGFPTVVGGSFDCAYNPNLTSLIGCPKEVGANFSCQKCNILSLQGCPKEIGTWFDCSNNINLKSLKYGPVEVGSNYYCQGTAIMLLEYVAKIITGCLAIPPYDNLITDGCESKHSGFLTSASTKPKLITIEQRYQRYSKYLSTLSPEDKANSISWLSRVDSELSSVFIQYAVDNNLTDIYSDRVVGVNKNISTRQNKRMPLL